MMKKRTQEAPAVGPDKKPKLDKPKSKFEKKSRPPIKNGAPLVKPEDWNAFKKKKKEERLKRKQKKTGYDVIVQAKKIGEKLRQKTLKGGVEERNKLINELHDLLKGNNFYGKFVLSHDMSRIVQWLLKYSPSQIKREISKELTPVTLDMFNSKYGLFCLRRLVKYGSKEIRNEIIAKTYGNCVKLSTQLLSASLFENLYSNHASHLQKIHLQQEFFGEMYRNSKQDNILKMQDVYRESTDLKSATLGAVKVNLLKAINKELMDSTLIQGILLQFLKDCSDVDRAELISLLGPHIVVVSNSRDGSRAAMECVWRGTNKDKKQMMKTMKEHLIEMSKHEHAHCVIIALLDSIDDTVLLHKIILQELVKNARDLAINEWGRKVLLWLVNPGDSSIFHPKFVKELETGREGASCKKDPDIRRKEILTYTGEALVTAVKQEPAFWLKNSSMAVAMLAILKSGRGNYMKEVFDEISKVLVDLNWKIETAGKAEILGVEDAGLHMVLKKLAKHDKDLPEGSPLFGASLVEHLTPETVEAWIQLNRGCFLILSVYENSPPETREKLTKILTENRKLLKKQTSTGGKILAQKITK